MALPTRKIGNDDVTAIGWGLMGLSAAYGSKFGSDEERFEILDAAVELGLTNWDTSDVYGDSEDLLGKWFKHSGKRDQIFLASKFGGTPTGPKGTPEYVRFAIERSLKRLGVGTIDLYYVHRIDQSVPIEITVGVLKELVNEGKIRYIGLSEASEATLRRAHAVHPISALQMEYSPFCLDIEDGKSGIMKACRELGVALVAYSPTGRGLLTGKFKSFDDIPEDDWRKNIPMFGGENFPNILKIVRGLEEIGKRHNATAAQVTLAWLLAQDSSVIPIPGTKQIKYLKENIDTFRVNLSAEEEAEIREVVDKAGAIQGDRYPAGLMGHLFNFADTPPLSN